MPEARSSIFERATLTPGSAGEDRKSSMDRVVSDFLAESRDNLDQLEQDLIALAGNPDPGELLASIFRTFHTIKGVAGFLNFGKLEVLAHAAEDLLSRLRDGELRPSEAITSALLAVADALREMLDTVAAVGTDGEVDYAGLISHLNELADGSLAVADEAAGGFTDDVILREAAVPAEIKPEPWRPEPANGFPGRSPGVGNTVRVRLDLLDHLAGLAEQLVLVRNQLDQFASRLEAAEMAPWQRLQLLTTELHQAITSTRMQPIDSTWRNLPRLVHELARACGKQVRLEIEGAQTELDRSVLERLWDPVTQILRNAIAHGIEPPEVRLPAGKPMHGRLRLRAFYQGGQLTIDASDDGAGLNLEQIRAAAIERGLLSHQQASRMSAAQLGELAFLPGISGASQVSKLAGRGVGLDVVRTNVEKLRGRVELHSRCGAGTLLRITLPSTLAIIPALIVGCCGQRFAIPQSSLLELARPDDEAPVEATDQQNRANVCRIRGRLLPLVRLHQLLGLSHPVDRGEASVPLMVLRTGELGYGLAVDSIIDSAEVVMKPLSPQLQPIVAYAGATILSDGRVALILDPAGIGRLAGVGNELQRPIDEVSTATAA